MILQSDCHPSRCHSRPKKRNLSIYLIEDYHDWIRQAMHLKTLSNAGLELWLTLVKQKVQMDRVEAIHKWRGLQADRTDYKAIFNEAKLTDGQTHYSHKPPKQQKADPIDPDLINKTIESLPTPEERNTARAFGNQPCKNRTTGFL